MSSATYNSNMGTVNGLTMSGTASTLNPAGAMLNRQHTHAKDPKARAKSREYLKQCLQEISYLTSASSLNPLPERGVAGSSGSTRPKKVMTDTVPPTWQGKGTGTMTSGPMRRTRSQDASKGNASKAAAASSRGLQLFDEPLVERDEENGMAPESTLPEGQELEGAEETHVKGLALDKDSLALEDNGSDQSDNKSNESDPLSVTSSREDSSQSSLEEEQRASTLYDDDDEKEHITAIFRPGGKMPDNDDWAKLKSVGQRERERRERERESLISSKDEEELQATSDRIVQLTRANGRTSKSDEEDLANLSLVNDADDETSQRAAQAASDSQMWKSKRVLRSHLDAVRAVVFDHQQDLGLYSASDDNTIKYWKLDPSMFQQAGSKAPSGQGSADTDPILTMRGHSAAVTCLAISSSKRCLYSGSVDSSILVWRLIDAHSTEPYPPFDKTMELTRLVGHTQAIWDLCLLPTKTDGEGLLASASADGTVKFWTAVDGLPATSSLVLSFDYYGLDPSEEKEREKAEAQPGSLPVPTSIAPCMSDLRKIAVSYSNSVVKLFEVETGKEVMQIKSDEDYDGTPSTQINKVLTHPTLPILITGHENNYIKFFDIDTGACTLSMVAHLDSVTCLDMDPSGLTLASGGHDSSVRYWDYDNEKNTAVCVQEVTAHRKKSLTAEGVLQVKYHPTAPWFCSAGADGVIRVYG
jgi:striatin 1/3/4